MFFMKLYGPCRAPLKPSRHDKRTSPLPENAHAWHALGVAIERSVAMFLFMGSRVRTVVSIAMSATSVQQWLEGNICPSPL